MFSKAKRFSYPKAEETSPCCRRCSLYYSTSSITSNTKTTSKKTMSLHGKSRNSVSSDASSDSNSFNRNVKENLSYVTSTPIYRAGHFPHHDVSSESEGYDNVFDYLTAIEDAIYFQRRKVDEYAHVLEPLIGNHEELQSGGFAFFGAAPLSNNLETRNVLESNANERTRHLKKYFAFLFLFCILLFVCKLF